MGQLGNGTTVNATTPVAVSGLSAGVLSVAAGQYHGCALTTAGAVECWGDNTYGQLGNGTTSGSSVPVPVAGLSSGVVAISAKGFQTCALSAAGAVQCWGYNNVGQLGNGTLTTSTTPTAVSGLSSGAIAIAVGYDHACAAMSSGAMMCWGDNGTGALGNGTTVNSSVPVAVTGLNLTQSGQSQSIAFAPLASVAATAAPFTVGATASSGLPVTFSTTTSSVCTVSGNTVTLIAAGTCTIVANQAGDSSYAAAAAVLQSFTVTLVPQTISFATIGGQTLGGSPITATVSASSGLAVTLTSLTPAVCNVNGTAIALVAVGTCTLQATQAGNGIYAAAQAVMQSFSVTTAATSGGNGGSADVPLPLWAFALLAIGLAGALWGGRRNAV